MEGGLLVELRLGEQSALTEEAVFQGKGQL